jgi:hypothetical protein
MVCVGGTFENCAGVPTLGTGGVVVVSPTRMVEVWVGGEATGDFSRPVRDWCMVGAGFPKVRNLALFSGVPPGQGFEVVGRDCGEFAGPSGRGFLANAAERECRLMTAE